MEAQSPLSEVTGRRSAPVRMMGASEAARRGAAPRIAAQMKRRAIAGEIRVKAIANRRIELRFIFSASMNANRSRVATALHTRGCQLCVNWQSYRLAGRRVYFARSRWLWHEEKRGRPAIILQN